jgi:2-polyprenyl-6-hydroxyphenyl methylase / 3-demethylubiquinone-9 3-methyltransferase
MNTKIYYNSIAKGYGELYHEEQENKIEKIKKYLNVENKSILDLGSGDGVLNKFIDLENNKLFSVDISDKLLKINSNKKQNKFCLDIQKEKLDLPDNSINLIISMSVFQDLENFENIISEIKRIAKKETIIIISLIKISKKLETVEKLLIKNFNLAEKLEDEIDMVFICYTKV